MKALKVSIVSMLTVLLIVISSVDIVLPIPTALFVLYIFRDFGPLIMKALYVKLGLKMLLSLFYWFNPVWCFLALGSIVVDIIMIRVVEFFNFEFSFDSLFCSGFVSGLFMMTIELIGFACFGIMIHSFIDTLFIIQFGACFVGLLSVWTFGVMKDRVLTVIDNGISNILPLFKSMGLEELKIVHIK